VSADEVAEVFSDIDKADDGRSLEPVRLRALVRALTGDIDGAIEILDGANSASALAATKVGLLENAGRCTSARSVYSEFLGPETGQFTANVEVGLATGAIRQVTEFARIAHKMGLTNFEAVPMELLTSATQMLEEFNIDDATVSLILDEAGAVLAENHIFYVGSGPKFEVIDIPGTLRSTLLTFQLPSVPADTVAMYMQFIDRLVAKNIDIPSGLNINFSSATLQ
jgi:hypothetical protein